MKKVLVIMNTDRVGGAERSMLLQLISQPENHFHFLIPNVSKSNDLEMMIRSFGFANITYFHYPAGIYGLSKKSLRLSWGLMTGVFTTLFKKENTELFQSADCIYLNGMKAAFYFFLRNQFQFFSKKVIWHFRDYWQPGFVNGFIWKTLNNVRPDNLSIVCNSVSTLQSLEGSPFSSSQKTVIYNPSGLSSKLVIPKQCKTIGFVSMLAPWKGIHEIILWAKMYEKELMELGIERVNFYGTDLYVTEGAHVGYANQLALLVEKLSPQLVSFKGLVEPEKIFSEIDCLIHYSLEAEPFGRVLIEAFHKGIPAISTCLGGASELIEENVTGISTIKYDLSGLMGAIRTIVKDEHFRNELIHNGIKKSEEIEENIALKMGQVLKYA